VFVQHDDMVEVAEFFSNGCMLCCVCPA